MAACLSTRCFCIIASLTVPCHVDGNRVRGTKSTTEDCSLRRKFCQGYSFRAFSARKSVTRGNAHSDGNLGDASESSLPPALDQIFNQLEGSFGGHVSDEFAKAVATQVGERKPAYEFGLEKGYVGLFVRLLGLDNPVEEREEAVLALRRHSSGGKEYIDQIVEFPGCLSLIVSLIPSNRAASAEAALGLLRNISSINSYRSAVVEAGALEEALGLLTRRPTSHEIREQAICLLWNLSVEEGPRIKLVEREILSVLLKMLESDHMGEIDAAAGVLANICLSSSSHQLLVEGGIVSKMAKLLLCDRASKVAKQEARNALLELSRDNHVKLLIVEEGLVFVPIIGASAYRSFKPLLQEAPPLPESLGALQTSPKAPSTFGAGELLLGLNLENGGGDIDEAERLIMEGRVRQQFLARIGLLGKKVPASALVDHESVTLMPWWDGITRLVLILSLDDMEVAKQAVDAICKLAVKEDYRRAVQKAGAIPHLVRFLGSNEEGITEAATVALEKLAVSRQVRRSINAHDAPSALVAILKASNASWTLKEKVVGALSRLSQIGEEDQAEAAITGGTLSGLMDLARSESVSVEVRAEAEEILDEMTSSKLESRDKIVAADGLPPLIDILASGSPSCVERTARVLENISTEKSVVGSVVAGGVEIALLNLLDLTLKDGVGIWRDGKMIDIEDAYTVIGAVSRLVLKLSEFVTLQSAPEFVSRLTNISSASLPSRVKDRVSACLSKLEVTD